jgi:hypothetical protein
MPITYSFDPERNLILTQVVGELNIAKTLTYFECLQQDENCPDEAFEVVDLSGVTDFSIQHGEMRTITRTYQSAKSRRNIRATVFNCTSDLSYGIARMLKTLHNIVNEKHTVAISRSHEELDRCIEELKSNHPDKDLQ